MPNAREESACQCPRRGGHVPTIPEIIWEASIGIYLTFNGFKTTPAVLDESRDSDVDPGLAIAAP